MWDAVPVELLLLNQSHKTETTCYFFVLFSLFRFVLFCFVVNVPSGTPYFLPPHELWFLPSNAFFNVFIALRQPVTSFPFHPLPRRLQLEVTRGQTVMRSSPPPNSRQSEHRAKISQRKQTNSLIYLKGVWKT